MCRELYWALEQDMLGYNSGKGAARRFARCLPCAVGKPGKCGSGSAAWFCRRRLSVFDTRSILLADKSHALLTCGEQGCLSILCIVPEQPSPYSQQLAADACSPEQAKTCMSARG